MRLLSFAIFFFISTIITFSQNIISNGDFEIYDNCPNNFLTTKNFLPFWYSPTLGTPDYYNKCSKKLAGIPENFTGVENAKSGDGYVGIVVVNFDYGSAREYIASQLKHPLERDKLYCIKVYISLADYSRYAISQIGIYFTKRKISKSTKGILMKNPQVIFHQNFFEKKEGWTLLCDTFKAKGGEKYLILGNFENKYPPFLCYRKKRSCRYINFKTFNEMDFPIEQQHEYAYYYVDNLTLVEVSTTENCECNNFEKLNNSTEIIVSDSTLTNLKKGEVLILKNIYFELDKSELLPSSYPELDNLANFLARNSKTKLVISGHTDDTGTIEYNQELSEARAKAVSDYLASKGIETTRLIYKGYGNTKPVDDNSTEEGRAKNRRVEIFIFEDVSFPQ